MHVERTCILSSGGLCWQWRGRIASLHVGGTKCLNSSGIWEAVERGWEGVMYAIWPVQSVGDSWQQCSLVILGLASAPFLLTCILLLFLMAFCALGLCLRWTWGSLLQVMPWHFLSGLVVCYRGMCSPFLRDQLQCFGRLPFVSAFFMPFSKHLYPSWPESWELQFEACQMSLCCRKVSFVLSLASEWLGVAAECCPISMVYVGLNTISVAHSSCKVYESAPIRAGRSFVAGCNREPWVGGSYPCSYACERHA